MRVAYCRDGATFDEAFEHARAAGCDEFVWHGARYHTKRHDEVRSPEPPVILRIEEIPD